MSRTFPIQQFLLADMEGVSAEGIKTLSHFRGDHDAAAELKASIHAALRAGGVEAVVVVGCSPAVRQERIVADIVHSLAGTDRDDRVLTLIAPPAVTSARAQLRVLHERYLLAGGALQLRYKHEPRAQRSTLVRTTEEEALIQFLRVRQIACVVIMHGELLVQGGGSVARMATVVQHVADVARSCRVPHVVVASRPVVLALANGMRLATTLRFVLQRVFNPDHDSDVRRFAGILNAYQASLESSTSIVLASRTKRLMRRVGGDPVRMAHWLCDALCAAAQRAERLEWRHLSAAGPRLPEINEANSDLAGYLAWTGFDPLANLPNEDGSGEEGALAPTTQTRPSPGVRRPCRDPVPRGRTAA